MASDTIEMSHALIGTPGEAIITEFVNPHNDDRLIVTTKDGTRTEHLGNRSSYTYQLEAFTDAVRTGNPPDRRSRRGRHHEADRRVLPTHGFALPGRVTITNRPDRTNSWSCAASALLRRRPPTLDAVEDANGASSCRPWGVEILSDEYRSLPVEQSLSRAAASARCVLDRARHNAGARTVPFS